jgi:hypothetical protein
MEVVFQNQSLAQTTPLGRRLLGTGRAGGLNAKRLFTSGAHFARLAMHHPNGVPTPGSPTLLCLGMLLRL